MTIYTAYTELTAFVMHQLPTGTSFAVSEDNSAEQIFIPSQVARMQNIVPGDRVSVRAIPNKREGGAKWFAVFASPIAAQTAVIEPARSRIVEAIAALDSIAPTPAPAPEPEPEPVKPPVDWFAFAKGALVKLGGVATSAEIADECGCSTQFIGTYLRTLHDRGEICRAGIRTSSKQSKDSLVYWGATLDDLIPAGIVGGEE